MSFANKVVLVTGGSSGIGATTAVYFAKEGADVAIVGRNEQKLKDVADDITKVGKKPLIIKADLTKDQDLKTIVKTTVDKYGKLDILVNNAGIVVLSKVSEEHFIEAFDEVMSANLRSAVFLTNLAIPHLIKTKGNIVNVSSIASTSNMSGFDLGYAAYCTSKAGMDHFFHVAALELSGYGVRVNTVNPGPVKTPILDGAGGSLDWNAITDKTALKKCSLPEDIANMILYFASDKASTITGSNIKIDSGVTLKF